MIFGIVRYQGRGHCRLSKFSSFNMLQTTRLYNSAISLAEHAPDLAACPVEHAHYFSACLAWHVLHLAWPHAWSGMPLTSLPVWSSMPLISLPAWPGMPLASPPACLVRHASHLTACPEWHAPHLAACLEWHACPCHLPGVACLSLPPAWSGMPVPAACLEWHAPHLAACLHGVACLSPCRQHGCQVCPKLCSLLLHGPSNHPTNLPCSESTFMTADMTALQFCY